ncbi:hypothetical protein [Aequorivita lipolytica]|uniref:DUF4760 domain-containing protein n=1 Tax=Aequorivita lipolytica TaxID=153267 RepID=A0A5C6YTF2_9FLAO|nr:hypothetical protein [Aequorivita lipolytica]TXD70243.1 hypothetical protein ESV24_03510 [Aequorivita lipolytica]SRX50668.1 hypothetical protein AEQU2_01143 [Aequorivita lipolytica]
MEIKFLDIIIIAFSFAAIVISILSFFQNRNLNKRQLRIEKLEEMLEIIHILYGNYQYFANAYLFKQRVLNEDVKDDIKEKYIIQIKELLEITNEITLRNKLARLFVLNNSYLPKALLKDKIGVFITVYTSIAENTITQSDKLHYLSFKSFPQSWEFSDFTRELQNEIIEEMKLGYKNNIEDKNNFEKMFKKRYNLD